MPITLRPSPWGGPAGAMSLHPGHTRLDCWPIITLRDSLTFCNHSGTLSQDAVTLAIFRQRQRTERPGGPHTIFRSHKFYWHAANATHYLLYFRGFVQGMNVNLLSLRSSGAVLLQSFQLLTSHLQASANSWVIAGRFCRAFPIPIADPSL